MNPIFSCVITKLIAGATAIVCMFFFYQEFSKVADIQVTVEPANANNGQRIRGLRQIVKKERNFASNRLSSTMDAIIAQNSHVLPERKNVLKAEEMCSEKGACIPKYLSLETRVRVAPPFKMLTCVVQKSMSTVMTAILCFLFDNEAYFRSGRDFTSEWSTYRLCKDKNEYNSVPAARDALGIHGDNMTGWSFSMVTRDPVERFISGFVDRCIRKPLPGPNSLPCNGCGYNMTCFLETELLRIQHQVAVKHLKRTFEDVHFFPQNWRCQLQREYEHFEFLRYSSQNVSSFIDQVSGMLERQNVPTRSIQFLRYQLTNVKTVHVTAESPARVFLEERLRSSPYLLEHVVRMFYHDFLLFNYSFPPGF